MRYFIVKTGFGPNDQFSIDERDLKKAIYAQVNGSVAAFKDRTIRGTNIIEIREDWHREVGWNRGYELQPLDLEELQDKGIYRKYAGAVGEARDVVKYLIDSNQLHLLDKSNDEIKALTAPDRPKEITDGVANLTDKMKLK